MKQIKANIAVSLDGFIATRDNELDWIPQNVRALLSKEYEAAHNLIMGTNTYTYIFEHWGGWPYKSKKTFVVSHYDANVTKDYGVEFLTDTALCKVHKMKNDNDILVLGGGKFLTSLIQAELLDCLTIYTIPIMLGNGIPFIGKTFGSKWGLIESQIIENGVICSTYIRHKSIT